MIGFELHLSVIVTFPSQEIGIKIKNDKVRIKQAKAIETTNYKTKNLALSIRARTTRFESNI